MIKRRGQNHQLLRNEDYGVFNELFVVATDGTLINVLDMAVDPAIMSSLEQRVDDNEMDIGFLKQTVSGVSTDLGLLEQRVAALEAGGGGAIDDGLLHQLLVRISTLENNFNINEHF